MISFRGFHFYHRGTCPSLTIRSVGSRNTHAALKRTIFAHRMEKKNHDNSPVFFSVSYYKQTNLSILDFFHFKQCKNKNRRLLLEFTM